MGQHLAALWPTNTKSVQPIWVQVDVCSQSEEIPSGVLEKPKTLWRHTDKRHKKGNKHWHKWKKVISLSALPQTKLYMPRQFFVDVCVFYLWGGHAGCVLASCEVWGGDVDRCATMKTHAHLPLLLQTWRTQEDKCSPSVDCKVDNVVLTNKSTHTVEVCTIQHVEQRMNEWWRKEMMQKQKLDRDFPECGSKCADGKPKKVRAAFHWSTTMIHEHLKRCGLNWMGLIWTLIRQRRHVSILNYTATYHL